MHHAVNSSGMCALVYSCLPDSGIFAEFLSAVNGWDWTLDDLVRTGERILNMRQAFNIREGAAQVEFGAPGRLLGTPAMDRGPLAGVTIDRSAC